MPKQPLGCVLALIRWFSRPDAVQIEPDGGFAWQEGWRDAFASVAGRVIVPPILRKLVLNRIPEQVQSRVAEIAEWDIQYVMAAHFSARVPFTSVELIEVRVAAMWQGLYLIPFLLYYGEYTVVG